MDTGGLGVLLLLLAGHAAAAPQTTSNITQLPTVVALGGDMDGDG